MYLYRFSFLAFVTSLFISCQSTEEVIPVITSEDSGLYASGSFLEAGQSEPTSFHIDMSGDAGDFSQTFWHGNVTSSELGATYILSAFPSERVTFTPRFGLQFWSSNLPADRAWTADELNDFFAPGTTFNFGRGIGKVEVSLLLPIGGPYDLRASRPSYLANPQGTLTVTAIEDYDYPTYRFGRHSYGKLIRCTFSGELGRYDYEADVADGMIKFFQTDEVVEILEGEVLFYVEEGE